MRQEPIEEVTIDVDDEYSGAVIEKITGARKGELVEMKPAGAGKTRIIAHVPSRGLIGYHGEFLTDTRGTGVLNRVFHGWAPHKGPIPGRRAGVLISMENGTSVAYALWNLEDRGKMFIGAQADGLYRHDHRRAQPRQRSGSEPAQGQEADQRPRLGHRRGRAPDHARSPCRWKQAIAYIDDDELVEVTPNAIRLRKRYLDPHERKRMAKSA